MTKECIDFNKVCDFKPDCIDKSDEAASCSKYTFYFKLSFTCFIQTGGLFILYLFFIARKPRYNNYNRRCKCENESSL